MKKLLFAIVLSVAGVAAITSCNNGPYDAHPGEDLSSALNPEKPDSGGVNVYLGSMEAIVNNKTTLFHPAFYYLDEDGNYRMVARVKDDSVLDRTFRMAFGQYNGVDSYRVNVDEVYPTITFTQIDTTRVDGGGRKIYNAYTINTGNDAGEVVITGEEGGYIRGVVTARLSRFTPEQVATDTINIKSGEFYFRKYTLPLPNGILP